MFWQLLFDKGGKPHSTLEYFCSSALWCYRSLKEKPLHYQSFSFLTVYLILPLTLFSLLSTYWPKGGWMCAVLPPSSSCHLHQIQTNQVAPSQSLFLVFGLFTKRDSVQCSKSSINSWFVKFLHKAGSGLWEAVFREMAADSQVYWCGHELPVPATPTPCFPEELVWGSQIKGERVKCKRLVNYNLCYSAQYNLETDLLSNIVEVKIHI